MIELAVFHNPVEADLARARLDAAGIEALLLNHNTGGLFGGALMPSRLMVLAEDEAEARRLLEI
ncbi:hypothetical protein B5C34_02060 [Pacificimonas flava]|uniref:DUF2007 domain-containing protein n=2 Tax=Pacificimonas TaxID=1960290 RepID=A0A219B1Y7_9SPHN|nr:MULTISPECIES: DUF2007 domain-containing protein [Pacificimonas]MBZ6377997.1 DUF2007 domain-containing protein [Pacificimonas aurantium]OWV32357.1 hypothetical protein B5C34_02060 [Pacificimonas flava]